LAINTADYCQTTALEVSNIVVVGESSSYQSPMQLEDKIREKIAEEFKEQVALSDERELFVKYV
jgi:hypothetical protein